MRGRSSPPPPPGGGGLLGAALGSDRWILRAIATILALAVLHARRSGEGTAGDGIPTLPGMEEGEAERGGLLVRAEYSALRPKGPGGGTGGMAPAPASGGGGAPWTLEGGEEGPCEEAGNVGRERCSEVGCCRWDGGACRPVGGGGPCRGEAEGGGHQDQEDQKEDQEEDGDGDYDGDYDGDDDYDDDDFEANAAAEIPPSDAGVAALPPLTDLIDPTSLTVKADVGWMLDFAIVGFAKCGTTWMMNYLRKNGRASGELWVNQGEVHVMRGEGGPAKLAELLYPTHEADAAAAAADALPAVARPRKRLYGIKNPAELEIEGSLGRYAAYYPHTRFIVSLRHPVKWFESFFNFRQYHHYPKMVLRPTSKLVGECEPGYPYKPKCMTNCPSGKMDVCTFRANFHHALSRLGKTPMNTSEEMELLRHNMTITPMPNRVFLQESHQIILDHPSSSSFTTDLHDFLGLDQPFSDLKPYTPPADKYAEFENKEAIPHLIHICDDEHAEVREDLVRIGREASKWIVEYLLESPDVTVSNRPEFVKLVQAWGTDPCEKEEP